MAAIRNFYDIKAWQLARRLTNHVYAITKTAPFCRDFGLVDQMRRAAGSIMHNIAEGFDAGTHAEFARFLRYARRSATEVQSQLYVALDQRYIDRARFDQLTDLAEQCKNAINGFIRYLSR